jgi:CRAL/TRIO domain
MSAWPWMKGCTEHVVDPIPPVDDEDDRPAVRDLIEEHRDLIERVKGELVDHILYDPAKHDDLWIVRFLISHKKNLKATVKAAKHTLQFRADLKLDERDMRRIHVGHDNDELPEAAKNYTKYCDNDTFRFVVPDTKRGVISYLKFSGFDQPEMVKHVSEDDWMPAFAFVTEWSHQWVDYVTRTTGRLTKTIRIIDLANVCMRKQVNPAATRRDGKALACMEDCYPQLLQTLFLVHAPVWVEGPWRLLRPIFPKRVVGKFDFISPDKHPKDLAKLTKYIDPTNLPERYGGTRKLWPDDTPPPKV